IVPLEPKTVTVGPQSEQVKSARVQAQCTLLDFELLRSARHDDVFTRGHSEPRARTATLQAGRLDVSGESLVNQQLYGRIAEIEHHEFWKIERIETRGGEQPQRHGPPHPR